MSADPTTAAELEVGQVFEGKYKILRELGRGGFGMVYLAFQQGMDRHVALKVLKSSVTITAPSAKERFLREVKIISKLKHPNTVTIHDFGETYDGGLYMVLEYVEGETLKQILKREGAQDPMRATQLAMQIAKSLSEAHRHGVVHRDLKPANIMVTSIESDKDFVKVLDFGVARLLDPKTNDLTSVGLPEGERELIGTPRYMSPEQVRGESLTGASDIYGLGLMLYEMLCGEPAVQGDTTMGLITQQISPEPLKLMHMPHFTPGLQDIIRISTSKRVQERFQTAEQMAEALEHVYFMLRRDGSMSGANSGEIPMASYQSQLGAMQPGWAPGSGWNQGQQQLSSGHWNQPAPYQSGHQHDPYQSGYPQDPYQSGMMQGSGGYPPHPGAGPGTYPPGMAPPHHSVPPGAIPAVAPVHPGSMPPGSLTSPTGTGLDPNRFGSGQVPAHGIDVPLEFEESATVERNALDPSQLIQRPQSLFDRNQHPAADLDGNLPPVPNDERPFVTEPDPMDHATYQTGPDLLPAVPSPAASASLARNRPAGGEETLSEFALGVLKACVFATLAVIANYFAFLVIGAFLAGFIDGSTRVIATTIITIAIPVLAMLGESSQKERFRVVQRPVDRVGKVLVAAAVFAVAAVMVISGAFANDVVNELRNDPNWFLGEEDGAERRGFSAFNANMSDNLASVVVSAASTIGLYKKSGPGMTPDGKPIAPRKAALPKSTRKGNEQKKSVDKSPRSEVPDTKSDDKGADYVKW